MALHSVLSVQVHPGAFVRYADRIQRLAEAARKQKEEFAWSAYQTLFGESLSFHFASTAESFEQLGARGSVPELVARVLGANEAPRFLDEVGGCIASERLTVGIDRPDLSYAADPIPLKDVQAAVVTRARIRSGAREAFEELLRKIAEAIPKVDDPAQLVTRQIVIGNTAEYVAIRPLRDLAALDAQRPPDQLLVQAFGAGEGGLIYRNGGDAIELIEREIVRAVPELSNRA